MLSEDATMHVWSAKFIIVLIDGEDGMIVSEYASANWAKNTI